MSCARPRDDHCLARNGGQRLPRTSCSFGRHGEILNLQMLCGGEEQAEKLEENFRKNAEKYYTQIMELLSRDEKV